MSSNLNSLVEAGVSVWLDDLSRDRLTTGSLQQLIRDDCVSGVTTNPSIFSAAIADGKAYRSQLEVIKSLPISAVIQQLCAQDVRDACDILQPVFERTNGDDGWVSIEVEPTLAHDAAATVEQARYLKKLVHKANALIKIPATIEGVVAIEDAIAEGISVNATLIFSVERYSEVAHAYQRGLKRALKVGLDLSQIRSVASVFISRVDTEVDNRLRKLGHPEFCGHAAIANAQMVVGAYESEFLGDEFESLSEYGAHSQRLLWASTGTKDANYPDTLYVSNLVYPGAINTMPEKTLRAFADHGAVGKSMVGGASEGEQAMDAITSVGVDLASVFAVLEAEGVQKFVDAWHVLEANIESAVRDLS